MDLTRRFAITLIAGAFAFGMVGAMIALAGGPRTVAAGLILACLFTAGYVPAVTSLRRRAGLSPNRAQ